MKIRISLTLELHRNSPTLDDEPEQHEHRDLDASTEISYPQVAGFQAPDDRGRA